MGDEPREGPAGGRYAAQQRERARLRLVGLQPEDLSRVMEQFGVSEEQVRRDHVISVILAALSESLREDLLFVGGTALSRTYLDAERLSEDIDLIAVGNRADVASRLVRTVERAVQRSHGRVIWQPGFSPNNDADPAIAGLPGGIAIRFQLLRDQGYSPWPATEHEIERRYGDVGPATLRTPTLPAFAGWKTSAWVERNAPRDLYDLWAMGRVGALDVEAAQLFARHGTTGAPPRSWMFAKAPAESDWRAQLAGQTRLSVTAQEALDEVRAAWSHTLGDDW